MKELIYVDNKKIKDFLDLEGKDLFDHFVFDEGKWSAKELFLKDDVLNEISKYNLEGRVIKSIKVIGHSFNHTTDMIEDYAFSVLKEKGFSENECREKSEYFEIDPNMMFPMWLGTDKLILIRFEDGDVFEVLAPLENSFKMSMNKIPRWIRSGTNFNNIDGYELFSVCNNKTITSVKIKTNMRSCNLYKRPYREDGAEVEVVSEIIIELENNIGILLNGWEDFFHVSVIDLNNHDCCKLSYRNLRKALMNWEDLHMDEVTRVKATSETVFFGENGSKRTLVPYMTLQSSDSESYICINADNDYDLLDVSSAISTGITFDEYGDFEYSKNEWTDILNTAERILNMSSFDELFEELRNLDTWDEEHLNMTNYLRWANVVGPEFWNRRDEYKKQLTDIKKWSELVMNDNSKMHVTGF